MLHWRPSRRTRESEVDRELAFHLDALTREYETAGMTPEAARRQARIDFGGREQVTQQVREVHVSAAMEAVSAHAKAALRFLRRAPGLSAAVILTLALAIGANTAVFSAIDAVLLKPLPFPEGDALMVVRQFDTKAKEPWSFTAPARLEDWDRLNHTFRAISGYYSEDEAETSGPLPERLDAALVAPRFLDVWGIAPELGRGFASAEEHFGGPRAILISDRLWRRRFAGQPDALGKQLRLNGIEYTVVGVMPASFLFPDREADVWMMSAPDAPFAQDRASTWFHVVGRLKPGFAITQVRADLATVQQELGAQFPKTDGALGVKIEPLKSTVVGDAGSSLWLLYGAVTLLLLIACGNIAALLLARTGDREREIALRFALGAGRRQVVGQMLSEVLLLALLGSLLGLALAGGATAVFHQLGAALPRAAEIGLDWRLLLYTFALSLAVTLGCGLYPALRGTRRELARSLALGNHTQVSARGGLQWLLVGGQVALAVTLLVGASLLLRSFEQLSRVSSGFDPDRVLTLRMSASWGETTDQAKLAQRIDRTLDALRATPGVDSAATSASLPGVPGMPQVEYVRSEGERDARQRLLATTRFISSGYFRTLSIPVLQGTECRESDPVPAVLVNRSFANQYLTTGPVLGAHLQNAKESTYALRGEIRGIVTDAREDGLRTAPAPTVYWCGSAPEPTPYFLIRTQGRPMLLAETLRRRLQAIEPARSIFGISPLTEHLSDVQSENRLRTGVLSFFAGTAIALACLGLCGTLTYLGRMRRREMGLRLAVGASRLQVIRALTARALKIVALGCVAGFGLGFAASRLLRGMLYGVSVTDPVTYGGIVLLVMVVAGLACLGPALRAATTDPVSALREE